MDIDIGDITIPNIDVDVGDFDFGSLPQYLEYDTDGDGVLNDAEYASYMADLTAWAENTNTDVSDDTYVPPEQTVGEVEELISGLSDSDADTLLEGMEAADRMVSGEETSTDWFYDLSPAAQAVAIYVASGGNVDINNTASAASFRDMNGTEYQVRGADEALATLLGVFLDPLANISNNPLGALAENRSRNATARAELRDKRQFINRLVNEEGYTREQARHIYYDYLGARDENPNKTLSDAQIDQLYGDYQAGNTPNAVAIARQTAIDNAGTVFSDLGYEATQTEKEQFADNPDGIAGYVDPRQLTRAELEAIAAEQNYTLQDSDYETYVGQGDENFQSSQTTTANSTFDPLAVTAAEAKAFLEAQNGYDPAVGEEDQFAGTGTESEVKAAVKKYVDPRQLTAAELEAIAAEQGYELQPDDYDTYVGQGDENFQANQTTAANTTFDPLAVTAEEARAFLEAQNGYEPEDGEEDQFVGTGTESEVEAAVKKYVDPRQFTAEEAEAYLKELGFEDYDADDIATLVGQGGDDFQATQRIATQTFVNTQNELAETARQNAITEAGNIFADLDYDATQAEKETYADNPDGIADYVQGRQNNAKELFGDYNASEQEIKDYASQPDKIEGYVEDRKDNAESLLISEGYINPSDSELLSNASKTDEEIRGWADPRALTEAEVVAIFKEAGYDNPSATEIQEYIGKGSENFEANRTNSLQVYVNEHSVTEGDIVRIAESVGYVFDTDENGNPILGDFEKYIRQGAKVDADQIREDAKKELDDSSVTAEELASIAEEEGYDLSVLSEEEQQTFIGNITEKDLRNDLDSRATTVQELKDIYNQRTGNTLSTAEAEDMLATAKEQNNGTLNEAQFEDWVDENIEYNLGVQLGRLGQNVLDIIFGTKAGGVSKSVEEILKEQMELLLPPSPSDPDYERKYTEWLKRRSGSIISVTHDPTEGIFAGVRFPVPIPIQGPEIKIPLFDEQGNYIGGNVAEVFVNEVGNIIDNAGKQIGQITGNVVQIFDSAGNVVRAVALEGGGLDPTTGLPIWTPEGWEEGDPNPFDTADTNNDGVIDQQVDENGIPIDPDTGLPVVEVPDDIPEGDRVAFLSDVVAAKEEVLNTLGGQLEALGLDVDEVKNILDGVQEQLNGVATAEDLEALRGDLTQTITDELAALGIDDIQGTLDAVGEDLDSLNTSLNDLSRAVGLPAREDDPDTEEDESRPATGIYAAIEEGNAATKEYIDGLIEDIEALNVDVAAIPGLIEGIIESTSAELEALGLTQEEIINLLGSPATDDAAATGLYATIDDLSTQIETLGTDLNARIDDLVADGASRADAVDQALAELAEANNTSTEAILTRLGTTEEELTSQISDLSGRVGTPAEYDDEGNLVSEATGLYAEINTLMTEQGLSYQEALDTAINGLSSELGLTEQNLLDALGTTKDELLGEISGLSARVGTPAEYDDEGNLVSEATGLYAEINTLMTEQGLSYQEALDTAINGLSSELGLTEQNLLDALGTTKDELLGEISGLSARVGTPAEYDDEGNLVSEATGLYAEINTLMTEQGLSYQEALDTAISGLSSELGLTEQNLLDALGTTKDELLGEISGLSARVGTPAEYDDEGNLVSEATGLYAEINTLMTEQGLSYQEALDTAISGLSSELGLTEQNLLDALGTTKDELLGEISGLSARVGTPAEYDDEGNLVSEATGLYAEINTLMTEQGLSYQEALDTAISGLSSELGLTEQNLLDALGTTKDELLGEISGLSARVGSPAEYDDEGNVVTEATGLYKEIDDLVAAGMARDEAVTTALANLAEQYNTSTESILAQLGTTQEDLAGLTTDLGDLSDRVGSPAEYDDEGNLVNESTGLYAEIDDLVAEGVARDEAINQVLSDLATAYDTNTETLLDALGTTEDAIREDIAGVAEDVAGVKEDVAGLADDVDNIDTRIDDLVEAGVEQTEAINTAIAELSDKYDLTTDEILDAISDSESRLSTQIGLPARVDDPDTEEDESRPATGLYAQIGAAEATITADISDLTDLVMAYEEAGLSRDEALATAISNLADQLGTTEENFLTSLGETETTILDAIGTAQETITGDISDLTDLVMAYEADGIARDEAITLAVNDLSGQLGITRDELLTRIGESESTIMDAIDASQMETNQYLDYISGVIGRPASELTQDDVDMVIDLLAEDEFITDFNNDMRLYDVNFDGQINRTDIDLLQGFVDAGVEGVGEIPATGLYADAARRQAEITGDIRDTQGLITTEAEATRGLIGTEAEETRRLMGAQNLFNAFLGSGDLMGQTVTEKAPDPVELKYIYDFSDIFATPQQRGLFPSPYGAPQRQAAQQISQQRGIMSGPLQLGGLQRQPGMAAGGKVDYDFTDEIMHIMSYGDS